MSDTAKAKYRPTSWIARTKTIRRKACSLMDEMMEMEGEQWLTAHEILFSDWADNIIHQSEELIFALGGSVEQDGR